MFGEIGSQGEVPEVFILRDGDDRERVWESVYLRFVEVPGAELREEAIAIREGLESEVEVVNAGVPVLESVNVSESCAFDVCTSAGAVGVGAARDRVVLVNTADGQQERCGLPCM